MKAASLLLFLTLKASVLFAMLFVFLSVTLHFRFFCMGVSLRYALNGLILFIGL